MKKLKLLILLIALFTFILGANSVSAIGEKSAFLFRLYNPTVVDHFYTANSAERSAAMKFGYSDEGITGTILTASTGTTATLFRLYNIEKGDHLYTTNETEVQQAVSSGGYKQETNAGFVYTSQVDGSIPLFRLFSPQTGDHLYTTNLLERLKAVERSGYIFEGVTGYIQNRLFNLVRVENISPNQDIDSGDVVTGEARGNWYFEGSFPIVLLDENGESLSTVIAQAETSTQTTDFVPYESGQLTFQTSTSADEGTLILEKDNPSGLLQNDDQLIIPVEL